MYPLLFFGAQKVLTDEGRKDLADQGDKLFRETLPGSGDPLAMVEFSRNFDRAHVLRTQRGRHRIPTTASGGRRCHVRGIESER